MTQVNMREENIFRLLVIECENERVQVSMIVFVHTDDKCVLMRVKVFVLFYDTLSLQLLHLFTLNILQKSR